MGVAYGPGKFSWEVGNYVYSNCSVFPGSSSFMWDNQSYASIIATPSSTVHNTKYLDPYHTGKSS